MQQTGQYTGESLYPSGVASYGAVPNRMPGASYYPAAPSYASQAPPYISPQTDFPAEQSSPYVPQSLAMESSAPQASYATPQLPQADSLGAAPWVPPHMTSVASLTDSMAGLNMASQGSYSSPVAYAPTVPPYEQSYPGQIGAKPQAGVHHPSASSQPYSYSHSRQDMQTNMTGNAPLGYDTTSASVPLYAANQQGLQSYGYNAETSEPKRSMYDQGYDQGNVTSQSYGYNPDLSQGTLSMYDMGSGIYASGGDYAKPGYDQLAGFNQTYNEKPAVHEQGDRKGGYDDQDLGEVYAYSGGNLEPYGSRGTGSNSWRALDSSNYRTSANGVTSYGDFGVAKLPKAVPKVDSDSNGGGVQKYRVKLLSDSTNGPMDVLCQIGLDGVRMISPSTGKTVRIYPLETITRWEVNEPSVFTFWAKSAVDLEPRRIRLQSGSYTTNAILDTLTAACVQFSEMVGSDGHADSGKTSGDSGKGLEQNQEKKKPSLVEWMSVRNKQIAAEEKQHWVPDEAVTRCSACSSDFGPFLRRHHCRNCGDVFCDKCTHGRIALTLDEDAPVVRVCDHCLAEVTQRLSNAKELSNKPPPRSHEDLAKKLQEELERNASKRPSTNTSNSSSKDTLGRTTVLTCNACGSISLLNGSSTQCPSCGVDSAVGKPGRDNSFSRRDYLSTPSSSDGSGKQMREVACPTCTVHLQVQVPSSGTETVECGVCQHPFLVSAH